MIKKENEGTQIMMVSKNFHKSNIGVSYSNKTEKQKKSYLSVDKYVFILYRSPKIREITAVMSKRKIV